MFDFRRATLFCLEKRLLKHKTTIFSKNLGGHGPFGLHLDTTTLCPLSWKFSAYTSDSVSHVLVSTLQNHRSKTSKLTPFGRLHFSDNWGWPCAADRMWLICSSRKLYHKKRNIQTSTPSYDSRRFSSCDHAGLLLRVFPLRSAFISRPRCLGLIMKNRVKSFFFK